MSEACSTWSATESQLEEGIKKVGEAFNANVSALNNLVSIENKKKNLNVSFSLSLFLSRMIPILTPSSWLLGCIRIIQPVLWYVLHVIDLVYMYMYVYMYY